MSDYEKGTVTISLEEYRDLCETNARMSILRGMCCNEAQRNLDEFVKTQHSFNKIENAELKVEVILNVIGSHPTWVGFQNKQEEMIKKVVTDND